MAENQCLEGLDRIFRKKMLACGFEEGIKAV
jgi:hypothetical protein